MTLAPMKTAKLLLAAALLAGAASLTFSSPPLPYWAQPARAPQAKVAMPCKGCPAAPTGACANCARVAMAKP